MTIFAASDYVKTFFNSVSFLVGLKNLIACDLVCRILSTLHFCHSMPCAVNSEEEDIDISVKKTEEVGRI